MMFLIFCLRTGVPKAITLGTFFKKKILTYVDFPAVWKEQWIVQVMESE